MKLKLIFKIFILFFSISVSSQVSTEKNKKDAIDYLNLFLSDESWAMKVDANFTYNKYSNSLAFKSKTEIDDKSKSTIRVEYILNFDNIKNIDEIVYKASNIIIYVIYLKNDIYYKQHIQKNGDVIPDYTNKMVKKVPLDINKSLTDQDFKNIQNVIRDIFFKIPIETKYYE